MSFAPSRKNTQRDVQDTQKSRQNTHEFSIPAFSQMRTRESDADVSYRLDVLTSNMVRINQQQEALLPVFELEDITPEIVQSEELAKSIQDRHQACEERLRKVEGLLHGFKEKMDSMIPRSTPEQRSQKPDFTSIEKNVKSVVTTIGDRDDTLQTVKANWTKFQKNIEKKAETQCTDKENNSEKKVELYSTAFNASSKDLHTGVNLGFERLEEALSDLFIKVLPCIEAVM